MYVSSLSLIIEPIAAALLALACVHYHSALSYKVNVHSTQGAATQICTVLAATTGIKMISFRSFTDVHRKPVQCRSMHGNILV